MNPKTPLTAYQWKLFVFLGVATFFEGYDFIALSQLLPQLREEFGLSKWGAGVMIGTINAGTILAWFLVRKADQWGRRLVLTVTISGYTVFTLLSGLSPNAYLFAATQLCARTFLVGEWAIANVYAAEEYPADRRGMVLGVLQGFSSLGSVVCAGVVVPFLLSTPVGWRAVYFVGAVPLVLVAVARRNLQESKRFETAKHERQSLMAMWSSPYRTRMLQMAAIWFCTYLCTQNAITFWKEYAQTKPLPNLTDADVGLSVTVAAVVSMPLVFFAGKLLDLVGRRIGATLIFLATGASCALAYTLTSHLWLTVALGFAIFGVSGVLPVLNSFNTELFPTEERGNAYAWSNNLIGRIGYVLSPVAVGFAAERVGFGPAVAATAVFPVVALVLILAWLPETSGKELEETCRLHG